MKHPSFYAYQQGCRCPGCTEANRLACREQRAGRAGRAAQDPALVTHGRYGYTNWGCRCETCTAGNRQAGRDQRQRARAQ